MKIFRKQRCEAAVKNSRELLVDLWNERRPECAHQLTGETRAPTRLHRCAVCDTRLHTGPSRFLPCWKAAGYSFGNDPLYIANFRSLFRELRSAWIATKMEHNQERRASRMRRDKCATCLPQERFERCLGGKPQFLPFSVVLERRVDGAQQRKEKMSFSLANRRMSCFCRRPAPRRTSSGR